MRAKAWTVHQPAEPMVLEERSEEPGPGEVLVEVAGLRRLPHRPGLLSTTASPRATRCR